MRIALSGKGGVGKTTIGATLARILARRGYRVNALDDDPNPNLAVALGLAPDQLARLRRVPREDVMEERADAAGHRDLHLTRPFADVLAEYGARGPDDVGVLTMTGLLGAGKG
jgi:CO dehydrogenase maturation factor